MDNGFGVSDVNPSDTFDGSVEGLEVEDNSDADAEDDGAWISMVMGGGLTSMIEYRVLVDIEAEGVMVITRVVVISGPSMVFVVRT